MNRTEKEYPFYPVKPEHEVIKPAPFIMITDEAHQERAVIDYSQQNKAGLESL